MISRIVAPVLEPAISITRSRGCTSRHRSSRNLSTACTGKQSQQVVLFRDNAFAPTSTAAMP